jgi:hypothetical protein
MPFYPYSLVGLSIISYELPLRPEPQHFVLENRSCPLLSVAHLTAPSQPWFSSWPPAKTQPGSAEPRERSMPQTSHKIKGSVITNEERKLTGSASEAETPGLVGLRVIV